MSISIEEKYGEIEKMIEIEGLPEGWKAVAYRIPLENKDYILDGKQVLLCCWPTNKDYLIVERIKPYRISFYEITDGTQNIDEDYYIKYKWWREVKETDIPLINEDANVKMGVSQGDGGYYPTLELNVKELRNVRSLIKDFENLGWFINPERALLLQKITEFIKDK